MRPPTSSSAQALAFSRWRVIGSSPRNVPQHNAAGFVFYVIYITYSQWVIGDKQLMWESHLSGNSGQADPREFGSLLVGLTAGQRAELLSRAAVRKVLRREEFRPRGEEGALILVSRGVLRIDMISRSGRVVGMMVVAAGEWFGGFALLAGVPPFRVSVTCEAEAELLEIPATHLKACLPHMSGLAEAMLMRASRLIMALVDRIAAMATLGLRDQLLTELLTLTRFEPEDCPIELSPVPTHADFAALFGVTRESVTRELSALSRAGVLRARRGAISIASRRALSAALSDQASIRAEDSLHPFYERTRNEVLHS